MPEQLPPAHLSEAARAWWQPFIDDLRARGSLPRVASHRLGMYCELFAQWIAINEKIVAAEARQKGGGQVQQTYFADGQVKDTKVSAEADRQIQLAREIRAYDKEFGFLNSKADEQEEADADTQKSLEELKAQLLSRRTGSTSLNG